jgi:hypothetical protein
VRAGLVPANMAGLLLPFHTNSELIVDFIYNSLLNNTFIINNSSVIYLCQPLPPQGEIFLTAVSGV